MTGAPEGSPKVVLCGFMVSLLADTTVTSCKSLVHFICIKIQSLIFKKLHFKNWTVCIFFVKCV